MSRGVCLVFEPAYDAHIPKGVVQIPIELAKLLGGCPVYLITRPNPFQSNLSKYVNVVHFGSSNPQNDEALKNSDTEATVYSPIWYEQACRYAAQYADILMLYPHYGNHFRGAYNFWLTNLLKGRRSTVYVKLDGNLHKYRKNESLLNPGISEKFLLFKSWLKHLPIAAISVESSHDLQQLVSQNQEIKNKSFIVKNCPPQSEVLELSSKKPVAKNRQPVFLTVARLGTFQKATEVLLSAWIRAAPYCPGWKLLLVGTCKQDFQQEWIKNLQEAGLENTVEWLGSINDRKVLWDTYSQASIFVLPSRYEGASLALAEAIRAGCAVIVTPVGEVPSLLDDSDPGVVPVDDVEVLSKTMVHFASDEILRNQQVMKLAAEMQNRQWPNQLSSIAERIRVQLLGKRLLF